jgi:hypothetical protein
MSCLLLVFDLTQTQIDRGQLRNQSSALGLFPVRFPVAEFGQCAFDQTLTNHKVVTLPLMRRLDLRGWNKVTARTLANMQLPTLPAPVHINPNMQVIGKTLCFPLGQRSINVSDLASA